MPQPYAPSAYPSTRREPERITPSGWWFALGALFAVIGIVGGIVYAATGFVRPVDRIAAFQRANAPGPAQVRLTDGGDYYVYLEYQGARLSEPAHPVTVEITDPDGKPVQLRHRESSMGYRVDGHEGRVAYAFTTSRPGTYQVAMDGEDISAAIGPGVGASFVGPLVIGGALIFTGLLACLATTLVVAARRGAHKAAPAPVGNAAGAFRQWHEY
ncbi:hypothetical protein [Nocardia arthritidis]|uniref:Uncharacterized protein n=1 Tax=Nocardia arthritidis TaxID=228602 RepID=A0A6G9Y9S5_9NOCA|nr:hypothetical protein [Nocardia arthritidis]QIS09972.1 hypothetical protein F5544_10370 [Nocardia arthritidis]